MLERINRRYQVFSVETSEGVIHARYWPGENKNIVIYIHGLQSHQEWFSTTGNQLQQQGHSIVSWDRLGSGLSTYKDLKPGDCYSYQHLIQQSAIIVDYTKKLCPGKSITLWGNSYGAKLALAFHKQYPDLISKIILTAPGLFIDKKSMPLPFNLFRFIFSRATTLFPSIIPETDHDRGARYFTLEANQQAFIKNDEKSLRSFTKRFYLETKKLDRYIQKRSGSANRVPGLCLLAKNDPMMDNQKTKVFINHYYSNFNIQTIETDPVGQHFLMYTKQAPQVIDQIHTFLNDSDKGQS